MTGLSDAERETLTTLLRKHYWWFNNRPRCACGWTASGHREEHAMHLADVTAPVVAQIKADAVAEVVAAECTRTDAALAEIQRTLVDLDPRLPLSAAVDVVARMRAAIGRIGQ